MGNVIEWLLKLLIFLMVAPIVIAGALPVLFVILPWLAVLAAVAGVSAGLTTGLIIRRRLPPRPGPNPLSPRTPPLGAYRVRRPRGGA